MSDLPQLILHIGAPKCGSSALQSALSMTPDLVRADGMRLRYTALGQSGGLTRVFRGRSVTLMAQRSAYGYASWPNMRPRDIDSPVFDRLDQLRRDGLRRGYVPVASNEGWISRADLFATHLARWGYPPVEVVAFVRPVVDWTNSAFWQWGIWYTPTMDRWLKGGGMPYRFGLELEAWSRIPNVRLRFARARPDAVARFASWQDVELPSVALRNASSSPALIGVLLRNRELRPNGHDSAVEFVVQRWCPPVPGRKPWAILARHVQALRPAAEENLAALLRISSPAQANDLRVDPRWLQERPYHAEIVQGVSPLDDRPQMAALHTALSDGVVQISEAGGWPVPALPGCPAASASLEEWDRVLVLLLRVLLSTDRRLRETALRRAGLPGLSIWLGEALAGHWDRTRGQLFSKSR